MAGSTTGAPKDVVRIIRAMDDEFVANAKSGNIAQLVEAFYADDAVVLPAGHPPVSGKADITEFWKPAAASVSDVSLETTAIEVSGDVAYGVGNYRMVTQAGQEITGKYVVVYRQRGGVWRAVVDSFSPNS